MYSYQELKAQTRAQLFALVEWNGFGEISKYSKKGDIIDFILAQVHEEEPPPMSVRIRRIWESEQ